MAVSSCGKQIQEGDLIFQTSNSPQSRAIRLATGSQYSHMGIVFEKDGQLQVLEAVEPVRYTPLDIWIKMGQGSKYAVKRLKNAKQSITPEIIEEMKKTGESFLGRHYDFYFEWSDDRIYCSELVWKIYKRVLNVEIGSLIRVKDLDLSHEEVKRKIKERFGDKVPMDEKVISPGAMYESQNLVKVIEK